MLAGIAAPAFAQSASGADANSESDAIVVTGIRASIDRSLELKRSSTEVVDAISAEDVGKLPDRNIAEALQRVTGVVIQRDRGEGDFVSIRALPPAFVRGTVNGRTFLSGTEAFDSTEEGATASTTGRATNFDVLPSELIETLEVKKSASAKDVEGGIGGTVNLATARPLKLGTSVVATARGRYSDLADKVDPSLFAMGSWSNGDNLGILVGLNYSERTIRQDASNAFLSYYRAGTITGPLFDLDNNGLADATQPAINLSNNPEVFLEGRKRYTANATIQWRAGDSTEVLLDLVYSKRKIDSTQYGSIILDSVAPTACAGSTTNPDGSIRCPSAVVENGTLISRDVVGSVANTFTDHRIGDEDTYNTGINISHDFSDTWNATLDLGYAHTSGTLNYDRTVFAVTSSLPGSLQYTSLGGAFIPTGSATSLGQVAAYGVRQTELRDRLNTDKEIGAKLDFSYSPEGSAISAFRFGVHYNDRTKTFRQFLGSDSARADIVVPLASFVSGASVRGPSNFLRGKFPGVSPSNLLFPNNSVLQPLRAAGFAITKTLETSSTFDTGVKTLAGYLQLDLDTKLGSLPLTGNAGVRVVNTWTDVHGLLQDFDIVARNGGPPSGFNEIVSRGTISDINRNSRYLNFLPSINLKLDLSDDVVARFGYSRSLTRPEFVSLAPALAVSNPSNFLGSSGNPGLKPYLADNLDLGVEWYFARGSALTVGVFHKQIRDYIIQSSATNVLLPEVGFVNAANVRTQGVTLAVVQRPENAAQAKISGLEVGYTHAFTFLPAPFDGLGVQANLTLVDSKLTNTRTGLKQPFPGVSDLSYNLAVFYDKGPIEARLAYSWRDDYLANGAASFGQAERYVKAYGQLDFSVNFKVLENVTVFVDGVNLTNKMERSFGADPGAGKLNPSRVVSATNVGRRFTFGAQLKF